MYFYFVFLISLVISNTLFHDVGNNFDECGLDRDDDSDTGGGPFAYSGHNEEIRAPWLAAIGISRPFKDFTVICSGSILNRRFILTGASCFSSEQYQPSHIRVGARHIESRFAEEREILDVKIHRFRWCEEDILL